MLPASARPVCLSLTSHALAGAARARWSPARAHPRPSPGQFRRSACSARSPPSAKSRSRVCCSRACAYPLRRPSVANSSRPVPPPGALAAMRSAAMPTLVGVADAAARAVAAEVGLLVGEAAKRQIELRLARRQAGHQVEVGAPARERDADEVVAHVGRANDGDGSARARPPRVARAASRRGLDSPPRRSACGSSALVALGTHLRRLLPPRVAGRAEGSSCSRARGGSRQRAPLSSAITMWQKVALGARSPASREPGCGSGFPSPGSASSGSAHPARRTGTPVRRA
jgi:hypothetical protein